MHPVLFRIPLPDFLANLFGLTNGLAIYSYGVMLGLSLVVGWYLTLGLAEKDGLPKETMANNYVVTAIAAVVGSRILYILTNLNEFESFGDVFQLRRGGLVAYGGFLGGFIGSYVYLQRHRIPLLPWADVAVPSLASGLMITRIGCYLFGCDFGQPLSASAPEFLKKLGTFPHWPEGTIENGSGAPAWVQHVKQRGLDPTTDFSLPVHPTQLYESLVGAGLLILLLVARKKQKFRGQIFLLFTFSYGVCRYLLEILRDDAERGSLPPALPEHVLIPLGLVIFAVGYVIGFSRVIHNTVLQRVTQVLAFAPAVVAYVLMKPESFGATALLQYSTSQAVAMATGLGASIAFAVLYKAALEHPEAAMALNLPPEITQRQAVADEDEEDAAKQQAKGSAEPEDKPVKVGKKGKKKKKKKIAARVEDDAVATEQDEAAGGEAQEKSEEPEQRSEEDEAAQPKDKED